MIQFTQPDFFENKQKKCEKNDDFVFHSSDKEPSVSVVCGPAGVMASD